MTAAAAPNPRRVRIFLAEKGIAVPLEPVDLGTLQHKSDAFTAVNPLQRVPALLLDDGTVHHGIDRDLPLFRGAAARAVAVRRGSAARRRRSRCGTGGIEFHLLAPVAQVFRHTHPAMKELEVPQVAEWAEANKPRVADFLRLLDRELEDRRFVGRRRFIGRRHHRARGDRLHEAGKARRCRRNLSTCGAGMRSFAHGPAPPA